MIYKLFSQDTMVHFLAKKLKEYFNDISLAGFVNTDTDSFTIDELNSWDLNDIRDNEFDIREFRTALNFYIEKTTSKDIITSFKCYGDYDNLFLDIAQNIVDNYKDFSNIDDGTFKLDDCLIANDSMYYYLEDDPRYENFDMEYYLNFLEEMEFFEFVKKYNSSEYSNFVNSFATQQLHKAFLDIKELYYSTEPNETFNSFLKSFNEDTSNRYAKKDVSDEDWIYRLLKYSIEYSTVDVTPNAKFLDIFYLPVSIQNDFEKVINDFCNQIK